MPPSSLVPVARHDLTKTLTNQEDTMPNLRTQFNERARATQKRRAHETDMLIFWIFILLIFLAQQRRWEQERSVPPPWRPR